MMDHYHKDAKFNDCSVHFVDTNPGLGPIYSFSFSWNICWIQVSFLFYRRH